MMKQLYSTENKMKNTEDLQRKSLNVLCTMTEWSEFRLMLEKLKGKSQRRTNFLIVHNALKDEIKRKDL